MPPLLHGCGRARAVAKPHIVTHHTQGLPTQAARRKQATMKQDGTDAYVRRVAADQLHDFTARLFRAAGTCADDAQLMAKLLVSNDLRGSSNHGTPCAGGIGWQGYVDKMLDGTVNPRPAVKRVDDGSGATTSVWDGDGGLGHIVCQNAIEWAIATAKQHGSAVATTRNHYHFGAAGTWTRQAVAADCVAIAVSSHRYEAFNPADSIQKVNQTSPISMGVPAGEQPPLVLDMGASMGLNLGHFETIGARPLVKELAMGAINAALGGILPGVYRAEEREDQWQPEPLEPQWIANQGSFLVVIDAIRLLPVAALKEQMDSFISAAQTMQPLPGNTRAFLPGGREAMFQQEYTEHGIGMTIEHAQTLQEIADRLKLDFPWERVEAHADAKYTPSTAKL